MELSVKSKITLTDFNPKRISTLPDTEKVLKLGVLIGRAVDTVERQSPDKSTTFIGIRGDFEAYFAPFVDASGKTVTPDPWKSGVLFMPETFQDAIIALISDKVDGKTGEVLEAGAEAVNFAYDVAVQRAGNAQGYEWVLRPLNERPEEERQRDKLAAMRSMLGKSSIPALAASAPVAQIADQSGATGVAEPAPAKKK